MLISFFLTIATLLNSIFQPDERFQNACRIGIKLSAFRIHFLNELEKLEDINEKLAGFIIKMQQELERIQKELIGLFLPEKPSNESNGESDNNERSGGTSSQTLIPKETTAH